MIWGERKRGRTRFIDMENKTKGYEAERFRGGEGGERAREERD